MLARGLRGADLAILIGAGLVVLVMSTIPATPMFPEMATQDFPWLPGVPIASMDPQGDEDE